jgi:hypothetical protein
VFVERVKDWDKDPQSALRFGHWAREGNVFKGKEPSLGTYGGSLHDALSQVFSFLEGHEREFVILKFSHTYNALFLEKALKQWFRDNDGWRQKV